MEVSSGNAPDELAGTNRKVLLLTWAATLGVMTVLIRLRYRLEALRSEVDAFRMETARSGN